MHTKWKNSSVGKLFLALGINFVILALTQIFATSYFALYDDVVMNDIAAGTKTAVTAMDWAGLFLISFILPAVLCPLINMFVRKLGWVKDGDMTLS
mgnify:CR=1 FL=1